MRIEDAQNIFDLRDMAKRKLPKWLFEFVDRGTEGRSRAAQQPRAFERIQLRLHCWSTSPAVSSPPCRQGAQDADRHRTYWRRRHDVVPGRARGSRAAKPAGIPFSLATGSITGMEEIADKVGGTLWMQL